MPRPARCAARPTTRWRSPRTAATLTVVVARQEGDVTPTYSIATRDTVFTWNVTSSGAGYGVTTDTRNGKDSQPTLAPDGRTVADGSPTSNAVHLWTPPVITKSAAGIC